MARNEREGGEEEEEVQEEGKAFKKTFTKKSKKIGRAVSFEDKPFKMDAEVKRLDLSKYQQILRGQCCHIKAPELGKGAKKIRKKSGL